MSMERYYDRRDAKVEALDGACPVCDSPKGASCRDRWGQPTLLVHRARYIARGIDPARDTFAMHDDPVPPSAS